MCDMENKGRFSKFWALLNRMPVMGMDRDDHKCAVVSCHTDGRTTRLSEMTADEYQEMIRDMEHIINMTPDRKRDELRKRRSQVLHRMQIIGVDTSDWECVNNLCKDSRIAGKAFRNLSVGELNMLDGKLRAIERKGGLKKREETRERCLIVTAGLANA